MWFRPRGSHGLGWALGQCRQAAGLTQAELAERLGINRTTVIDMESGGNRGLQRLVEALSITGYDVIVVPRTAAVIVDETGPE